VDGALANANRDLSDLDSRGLQRVGVNCAERIAGRRVCPPLRWSEMMDRPGIQRRGFLMAAAAATSAVAAGGARSQSGPGSIQTDNAPTELAGKPMRSLRRRKAPGLKSGPPTRLGQSGADGSDAGRLAAARRYFARRRLPGVGRSRRPRDRRGIRGHGGGSAKDI
jgi:hypothetical protein